MTKAQLLAVGSTAELEPAEGCDACKRLRTWAQTAWARGHEMGMAENRRIAREATEALQRERDEHAETNARLTEAMLKAEEEAARMRECLQWLQARHHGGLMRAKIDEALGSNV